MSSFLSSKFYLPNSGPASRQGMVLLLSVIILSMILSTSLGVFFLIFSGLRLSTTTRDSQLAYYAADAGVECALYVDFRGDGIFGTTTAPSVISDCYGSSNLQGYSGAYENGARFKIDYGNGSCVNVTVDKISRVPQTLISSIGRSPCNAPAEKQVNRSLEVKY